MGDLVDQAAEKPAEPLTLPLFPPRTLDDAVAEAGRIVAEAREQYRPVSTWILYSGGDDSAVVLDVCKSFGIDGVAHINTGIGIPEAHAHAREQMAACGLPWRELHPPESYRSLVLGRWRGFPGPGMHGTVFQRLKERCVRQLVRENKRRFSRQKVMLLSGVRRAESKRRMGYSSAVDIVDGAQLWVNPLIDWSNEEMASYRSSRHLPRNPVAEHLHMSGECCCGAFANEDSNRQELEAIRFFYPQFAAEYIDALEAEVQAAGLPYDKWGMKRKSDGKKVGHLCQGCDLRMTLFDAAVTAPSDPSTRTR